MKRNNLKWALPIAALFLLVVGCSKNDDVAIENSSKHMVTIRASVGSDDLSTRSTVDLDAAQAEVNGQKFYWSEGDAFNLYASCKDDDNFYLIAHQNNLASYSYPFTIAAGYSNDSRSKAADFTGEYTPHQGYKGYSSFTFYALLPQDGYNMSSSDNGLITTYTIPASVRTQIGQTTGHLDAGMFMYAKATGTDLNIIPALQFKHLTSLLRFSVTNNRSTAIRLKNVTLNSFETYLHHETGCIQIDKNNDLTIIDSPTQPECDYKSELTVNAQQSATDKGGLIVAAGATVEIYTVCLPGSPVGGTYSIAASLTVTDTDGANETAYTALKPDVAAGFYFEAGKRYWFNLSLKDKLAVIGLNEDSWNTDTTGGSLETE